MRHLLGVLHAGEDLAELAPQPTLRGLDALVERSRAAGLPVRLRVEGERRELPAGLDLAAYRVVQEALTNALKHGGGSADVLVRFGADELGSRSPTPAAARAARRGVEGGGHGLRRHARARARVRRRAARRAARRGGGFVVARDCPCRTRRRRRSPPRRRARPHGGARMSVRILIADDQALVRAGFKMILDAEDDLEVVGEAVDGAAGGRAAPAAEARRRADGHPHARARRHRGDAPRRRRSDGDAPVRVLMLTTFDLNEYVYEALRAGASGFLLKDVPPEQLAAGIRVVARRRGAARAVDHKRLIQEFAEVAPAMPEPPPGLDELTARELEVFKLVARGLSNAEIAAELVVSETTVKTHVARMLMKLGLRDRVQAVVLAYEHGVAIPGQAG